MFNTLFSFHPFGVSFVLTEIGLNLCWFKLGLVFFVEGNVKAFGTFGL